MQNELITDMNSEQDISMIPPATGSSNINVGNGERIASVLAGTAATVYGLRNISSVAGIAATLAGGMLLSRGLSGYCSVNNAFGRNSAKTKRSSAIETNVMLVINKPRAEVYAFWRQLDNLPLFMKHLEEVIVHDSNRSTWKAQIPGGLGTITWEATIDEDKPGELIMWSSLPGSTIDNAGEVSFEDAPNGAGTVVRVRIDYRLPAGDVGSVAGKLMNPVVEKMVDADIHRFKSMMEQEQTDELETESVATDNTKGKSRKGKASRKKSENGFNSGTSGSTYTEPDMLDRI